MKRLLCAAACALLAVTVQAADSKTNSTWVSSIAAGMSLTSGNSDTLMANLNFLSTKKWLQNELLLGADANYGETDSEKSTDSQRAYVQYNRLFTERLFGYLRVEGLRDDIADIEYRFTFSPGVGYYFIKNDKTFLSAELGPGYVLERQGGVDDDYMTLRIAERFEHKLSATSKIWQSLEFLPQVDDWENFIINAEIGVETSLTKTFALRAYLQDTYDNEPAPGRKENDLKLVVGVAYKF